MSVKGINKMIKQQYQLSHHKGPYYDTWFAAYNKWVKSRSVPTANKHEEHSRWVAGMNSFIQDEGRKHGNSKRS